MSAEIIVSYDGTPNDDDALALGRALAAGGASLALAYVRHSREFDPRREELAQHDAARRLEAGMAQLGGAEISTHVIFSASTNEGLEQLAREEGSAVVVFGSDYRTAPGRAEPGNTAQRMLEGGPLAIAVARAGLRLRSDEPIRTIAVAGAEQPYAIQTAQRLAEGLGASLTREPTLREGATEADLIVVGSRAGAPAGLIALSGPTRSALNSARGSVLVLPAGRSVSL